MASALPANSRASQREVPGRFGADDLGDSGEPRADGGGLVLDDVLDGGAVVFERKHGGGGRVVEVDERGHATAVADDQAHLRADSLDL
jgi:hypothetical protein